MIRHQEESCEGSFLRFRTTRYLWYMYKMGDSDAAWLSCCPLQVKQTPLQASRASASFWAPSVCSPCLRCAAATTCASNSPCTCTRVSAVVPLTLLLPGGQATRFSALVYLRAVALEINTRSPVRPRRCNYTTPPDRKNNTPHDRNKISSNPRRSGLSSGKYQLARRQTRCDGRWGSQREQKEHLHPKPRL